MPRLEIAKGSVFFAVPGLSIRHPRMLPSASPTKGHTAAEKWLDLPIFFQVTVKGE